MLASCKGTFRFSCLIQSIQEPLGPDAEDIPWIDESQVWDHRTCLLMFINALISSTADAEGRQSLRSELELQGFMDAVEVLFLVDP